MNSVVFPVLLSALDDALSKVAQITPAVTKITPVIWPTEYLSTI